MDLGTMITTNNGMLEVDNEDDASAMTGTTKKSETNQKIDISDIFFDTDTTTENQHPTKRKKHRKRKPRRTRTQRYGKQAANSDAGTGGQKRGRNNDQQEGQSSSNGSSGNDNDDQNTQNNDPPTSPFNDDRCPGRLESTDSVDVEEFQTYTVTVKFKDVSPDRIATVLKAYSSECMAKVP